MVVGTAALSRPTLGFEESEKIVESRGLGLGGINGLGVGFEGGVESAAAEIAISVGWSDKGWSWNLVGLAVGLSIALMDESELSIGTQVDAEDVV